MDNRATSWSVTINNPTSTDEEQIALARQKGWKVEGQLEQGEEGTKHYQLLVKTPQVRFSAVKKAFPRAHVEQARNVVALQQYVNKVDTRLSKLPTSQEKYPSLSKFWILVYCKFNACNYLDMCDDFPKRLWTKEVGRQPILSLFDHAVGMLIDEGYHVESIAVNPATRSMFKVFWQNIFQRTLTALETERQTDSAVESEISIPTIEHNHANQEDQSPDASSPRSSSSCASQEHHS